MKKHLYPNYNVIVVDETERFGENKVVKTNAFVNPATKEIELTLKAPEKKDTSKNPPIHNGFATVRVLKNDDFQLTMRIHRGEKIEDKLDAMKLDLAKAVDTINEYNIV